MRLKLNQEIQIETRDGKQAIAYKGQIKEIKSPLITAYLPGQKTRELFPLGSFQDMLIPGQKKKIKVKIEQNENIPYLNLRILGKDLKKKDAPPLETIEVKTLLKDIHREEFRSRRSSLRIVDSFPIEFYLQSPGNILQKEKSYVRASSRERKRRFLLENGIMPPEVFLKIDAMGHDLFDVFSDIYRKIAAMSGIDLGLGEEEERTEDARPENLGTCIDMSGSGLRFLSGTQFQPKDVLKVLIAPPAAKPLFSISALVKVIRVHLVKDGPPARRYATLTKYYAINEQDLETLTRYTVLRQMEQRAIETARNQIPMEGLEKAL